MVWNIWAPFQNPFTFGVSNLKCKTMTGQIIPNGNAVTPAYVTWRSFFKTKFGTSVPVHWLNYCNVNFKVFYRTFTNYAGLIWFSYGLGGRFFSKFNNNIMSVPFPWCLLKLGWVLMMGCGSLKREFMRAFYVLGSHVIFIGVEFSHAKIYLIWWIC